MRGTRHEEIRPVRDVCHQRYVRYKSIHCACGRMRGMCFAESVVGINAIYNTLICASLLWVALLIPTGSDVIYKY